jgi:hypothetical protein
MLEARQGSRVFKISVPETQKKRRGKRRKIIKKEN